MHICEGFLRKTAATFHVELLRAERQARQALEELNTSIVAEVRVGVFATAAASLLAPVLSRLRCEHPKLVVRCVDIDVDDATAAVSRGELDLAFGLDYDDAPIPGSTDVELIDLRTERFGVASVQSARLPTGSVSLSSPLARSGSCRRPARTTDWQFGWRVARRVSSREPPTRSTTPRPRWRWWKPVSGSHWLLNSCSACGHKESPSRRSSIRWSVGSFWSASSRARGQARPWS